MSSNRLEFSSQVPSSDSEAPIWDAIKILDNYWSCPSEDSESDLDIATNKAACMNLSAKASKISKVLDQNSDWQSLLESFIKTSDSEDNDSESSDTWTAEESENEQHLETSLVELPFGSPIYAVKLEDGYNSIEESEMGKMHSNILPSSSNTHGVSESESHAFYIKSEIDIEEKDPNLSSSSASNLHVSHLSDDEDIRFFMSLLPEFRKLSVARKARVKNLILQLISPETTSVS